MRSTFNLKDTNKDRPTSIRFIVFFKNENKKMVYSTGEIIHPDDWDFESRQPKHLTGRNAKANEMRMIKHQLDRYQNKLIELANRFKILNQELTIDQTKKEFNKEFKRAKKKANQFFEVYELFLEERKSDQSNHANSETTIKRYSYNKKLLEDFQEYRNKEIRFNQIDDSFFNELVNYCVTQKKHAVNTLSRNMGLFKTFMNWAFTNNYTYKEDYKSFKNIKKEVTQEVALTLNQVKEVYEHDFSNNRRLQRVRDLFVFGCATGMRFSNYSLVNKSDVYNGHIHVRDKKNSNKLLQIPLNDFSLAILEKYDYKLPKIANQKFNDYIKEVFEKLEYTQDVKKTSKIGNKVIEKVMPLYKRISSHTARRSFITIMKNKKIPDKVIMSYTGHKSLEIFNKYYKPNEEEKAEFMKSVWSI
ncbi:tyrosine-type recombinase/integrase [Altibacter sp. HG106]|uniref:tyrosine-type recombinase/integrase n=1 Tax=Altibacter sp. HG106 TaxID=3023937 RepID=UPI002350E1BE|nr:tyrosine-type recombinase/integrase [Altibacter sp. HG106]MDC7995504.1 tyrosine-type recombinase/integrase [Altibacter sp. HG106]